MKKLAFGAALIAAAAAAAAAQPSVTLFGVIDSDVSLSRACLARGRG